MTTNEPLLDALDELVEAQSSVLDALRNVRDVIADGAGGPTDPPGPGELAPPAGWSATYDTLTRRVTSRFIAQADWVEIHEFETDPANTLKATMPPGATVRVSSPLAGGHPYRWGACSVRDGQRSAFTELITTDVPLAGGDPDDDEPGEEEPPPPTGGATPVVLIPELETYTVMLPRLKPDGDSPQNDYAGKWGNVPGLFYVRDRAVVFRCPADGDTSANSDYPRSEARQMRGLPGSWDEAAWSSSGSHSLALDLAFDLSHLSTRVRAAAGQIHGGGDDVGQLIYDGDAGLGWSHDDGDSWELIDGLYRNGQRFTCTIIAEADRVALYYNGERRVDIPERFSAGYWKFGCYLQTGGDSRHVEPAGAYGEVVVWSAVTTGGAS